MKNSLKLCGFIEQKSFGMIGAREKEADFSINICTDIFP